MMEETISLQDILKTLKKHIGLILGTTIGAGIIAVVISFFLLTPIYEANTQILVNQQADQTQSLTTTEIQSNLQLINTYNVIIKSPAILSLVIEELDLEMTPEQLTSKITVSNANDSQVVNINVQDEKHFMAVDIANTVATVFQQEIPELMKVNNVNILSSAVHLEEPSPVKPNKMLNVAIALVLGLMIGVGLSFLIEFLDTTIKSESEIEELINLPVIGLIGTITEADFVDKESSAIRDFRSGGTKNV